MGSIGSEVENDSSSKDDTEDNTIENDEKELTLVEKLEAKEINDPSLVLWNEYEETFVHIENDIRYWPKVKCLLFLCLG